MKNLKIALAGNPNAGKTTIFNQLTGARQHVANYPGVTVEKKEGSFEFKDINFKVVDLPGTYSLSAYSAEELIARNFIIDEKPDVVVDIIDASNLERNLYLAVQIIEMGVPVILVFNMIDEAEKRGIKIDKNKLSRLFNNIKIIETVGNKGVGVENLKEEIYNFCIKEKENFKPPKIFYGEKINNAITEIEKLIEKNEELCKRYNKNWLALKLLENDKEIKNIVSKYFEKDSELFKKVGFFQKKISSIYDDTMEIIIAEKRYGFISGACTEAVVNTVEFRHDISDYIDKVLTNKFLGIPLFLILMYFTFQLTFSLGSYPMDWIEKVFSLLSDFINKSWPGENPLKLLITQGIIGGVGSVLVFLPNIILLFFAIGILEFTGYMARAAFILDKIMHKIGLHGKSFIPMLIGFGCNVPGIMATRTLNTEKERLITILVLPLMSCGARLPVYLLIIPAFFPKTLHAPIMWLIYVIGILLAVISATILNKFAFTGEHSPFIMELPPYRIPTLKAILIYIWEKSYLYVRKAGTIILAISIILWFLSSYPKTVHYSKDYDKLIKIEESTFQKNIKKYIEKLGISNEDLKKIYSGKYIQSKKIDRLLRLIHEKRVNEANVLNKEATSDLINLKIIKEEYDKRVNVLKNEKLSETIQNSYIGKVGKALAPIFAPIGFDWKITTAVISAVPAKEVFVSQLAIINAVVDEGSGETLRDRLKKQYTPLIGFCVMIWVLIATPCIATVAIVIQETGSWKWAFYQFFGLTLMAYLLTFIVFQVGRVLL